MRLVRFGEKNNEKPGVWIDGVRKDCSAHFDDWNKDFFSNNGLQELQKLLDDGNTVFPEVPSNIRWGACVSRPNMILCVGLNYTDHAIEAGMEIPTEPVLFMKATNTLCGPYDNVSIPKLSQKTDWEVELAIVLKKDLVYSNNEEEALQAIGGYCIMHDVSEREFQVERGGQWVKGKSCPGFSPVGPYLVTPDAIPDVLNLNMNLTVNGEEMQNGNTKTMIFKPSFLIHYISQFMQLEAGDIITTGTPPGVGFGKTPAVYLRPGDEVELTIEHLGRQKQLFV
ncbi:2-keto-4-pentenoate hydratase/2-oxohepta-3-ene-1,7-dioic acid hydratase (catechol pathway) [Arenibacter palladensis]|uniref:2-keto-4-pentenoate hydratase/2-oxohepta-3-ene-1,7-dioic acid hydratase (Catechol pathway) n=1 Tax=Arenibacter palladensis TaxID=237373 RepID=A0A1M4SVE1_9FLAO|nr:fumarylacetoacetate hydrolase family protein [Arenibacter palladensis]SHE36164.1 2-keto-4-pentenoate hydratase/2-oxohepta-3-ene-1,7-dioic acid hydratase (catechol pathway) [Arenibacter palladensis]